MNILQPVLLKRSGDTGGIMRCLIYDVKVKDVTALFCCIFWALDQSHDLIKCGIFASLGAVFNYICHLQTDYLINIVVQGCKLLFYYLQPLVKAASLFLLVWVFFFFSP